jgi:hypothetical protein
MTFKTHNELVGIHIFDTHKVGNIDCSYFDLVACFGEPMDGDGYKVDAEWWIQFDSGEVATIYNWKNGHNYLGDDGTDTVMIDEWTIGGKHPSVVANIMEILTELQSEPGYMPS